MLPTLAIDPGLGADVADFTAWSAPLTLDLAALSPGFAQALAGPSTGDTLVGRDFATSFTISGADSGSAGALAFFGFENITGGSSDDTFNVGPGGSLTGLLAGRRRQRHTPRAQQRDQLDDHGPGLGLPRPHCRPGSRASNASAAARGDDVFAFANGITPPADPALLDPGGGTNTLDFSAWTGALALDLSDVAAGFSIYLGGAGATDTLIARDGHKPLGRSTRRMQAR